jgi:hypothetical protein
VWWLVGSSPQWCQNNGYAISMCCFSAKHTTLRRKSKDWLPRNRDNMSEWIGIFIRGMLSQWASTKKIQQASWSSTKRISLYSNLIECNLFPPFYIWKLLIWRQVKQHLLTHFIVIFHVFIFVLFNTITAYVSVRLMPCELGWNEENWLFGFNWCNAGLSFDINLLFRAVLIGITAIFHFGHSFFFYSGWV